MMTDEIFAQIPKKLKMEVQGMKTIKDYYQEERFIYGKKNCMVLEHMDDGTLCMVLDEDFKSEFGETNNFAESKLRKKLNGEYLDEWVKCGAVKEDFVLMEVDLTTNDGLKDYGTCECFLAPRTCDQHRKYRYLIPNPKRSWEWTVTAHSTKSNGCYHGAYRVTATGSLYGINGDSNVVAYGVRPLFKLNPDTVIVPDTITVTIPLKMAEPQMPSKAEPCEHELEDLYYCSDDYHMIKTRSVWARRGKHFEVKSLVFCKKCGQVFVKDFETNDEND